MKNQILILVACLLFYNAIYAEERTDIFCVTSNNKQLNTDVYILLPEKMEGQLLSGQFCRIAGNLDNAAMTFEEMNVFMEKEDKSFVKYYGDAYLIFKKDKRYVLAEIIRNEDDSFEPLKIVSMDKIILNNTSFVDIIIPRKQK